LQPYYSDELVTLFHGDCRDVMAAMAPASVDAVVTDPPYSAFTHGNAVTNKGSGGAHRAIDFDSMTEEECRVAMAECGRVSRGWVVTTLEWRHAAAFDANPPLGLRMLRVGVWVKNNPTPQISGDRPAQGWEAIAYMHRADVKPTWTGGGRHGNFITNVEQGTGHPTVKPLRMIRQFIEWFVPPVGTVFDPFAGSGTTLRAAMDAGRRAIGVELREDYCESIVRRLAQGTLFGAA